MKIYRQGDILLKKLDQKPDLNNLKKLNQKVIVGYGEVTGHKHAIVDNATAYAKEKNDLEIFALTGITDKPIFIEIEKETELKHEEHGPIKLSPGWYEPVRQKEYEPGRFRYVQD